MGVVSGEGVVSGGGGWLVGEGGWLEGMGWLYSKVWTDAHMNTKGF